MASCKDCMHDRVCSEYFHAFWGHTANKHSDLINAEPKDCPYFKDRSCFVELSHAEWVEDEDMYGDTIYHCSNCNEHFVLEEGTPTDNCYFYCPSCGAKMDEQALKERETIPNNITPEATIIELNRCKVNGFMPVDVDRRGRAIERAKAALRKQVPMKVGYDDSMSPGFPAVRCGRCTELVEKEYSYCPACGQALDWSEPKCKT